jgi:hypothetical protein
VSHAHVLARLAKPWRGVARIVQPKARRIDLTPAHPSLLVPAQPTHAGPTHSSCCAGRHFQGGSYMATGRWIRV